MRCRQASAAARSASAALWRDSMGLVLDLEAVRLPSNPASDEAPPSPYQAPYWSNGFEAANSNEAPAPRSRDLGSRPDMSARTSLAICLYALLLLLAQPAPMDQNAPAPLVAQIVSSTKAVP